MPRVLVIEDEASIQKLAKTNLNASGYEVLVANNGEEGLKIAQQEALDLILLDVRLPGISGWDVLMLLESDQKLHKIPVVVITATVPQRPDGMFPSLRTAGHLTKPFEIEDLLLKLKQALGM